MLRYFSRLLSCVAVHPLSLAVAAGWWLVADGGVHILFRDFSPATITRPQ